MQPLEIEAKRNIRVAVRVRPFSEKELAVESRCIVNMEGGGIEIFQGGEGTQAEIYEVSSGFWSFDKFKLDQNGYRIPDNSAYADQARIYESIGREMVHLALQGNNTCCFAYGTTGTGKTYTLYGDQKNPGLVMNVADHLFEEMDNRKYELKVEVSMYILYNEKLTDLLGQTKQTIQIRIKQTPSGQTIQNQTLIHVKHQKQLKEVIHQGRQNSLKFITMMGCMSSRLTYILILKVTNHLVGQSVTLKFVELAGSQRSTRSDSSKTRLEEMSRVNKSIRTLEVCLAALIDLQQGKKKHVPYRDSVLTHLLKNQLGGDCATYAICTISPSHDRYEETRSVLRNAAHWNKAVNNLNQKVNWKYLHQQPENEGGNQKIEQQKKQDEQPQHQKQKEEGGL